MLMGTITKQERGHSKANSEYVTKVMWGGKKRSSVSIKHLLLLVRGQSECQNKEAVL